MALSDYDKQQIKLIDEQVQMLQERNASDEAIIDVLMDFIPDVRCLIESTERQELALYLNTYEGFTYFISILSLAESMVEVDRR